MRLRPSDSGPRLAVGVQGSGKSYGQRRDIERAAETRPLMVCDLTGEWGDYEPPPHLRVVGARSVERAVKEIEDNGAQLVVVQPEEEELVAADRMCEWALWRGRERRAGVVFPEAHDLFPISSKLPKHVRKCVKASRHHGVAFFADTQRLAELNTAIRSAAWGGELRLYAFSDDVDLRVLRPPALREAVERIFAEHFSRALACCFEGCAKCAKHRGYFVTGGGPGPFPIERDE